MWPNDSSEQEPPFALQEDAVRQDDPIPVIHDTIAAFRNQTFVQVPKLARRGR
jgi:hypothetical protein